MWPVDDVVKNFTRNNLESLAAHGLHSSVAGIFNDGRKDRIVPSDCICYPWLVVEHKKLEQAKEIECYCQAANAAAAELMMFRTLVKYATHKIVPPVVTMTTVGEFVRIWIAYFDTDSEQYVRDPVYSGKSNVEY